VKQAAFDGQWLPIGGTWVEMVTKLLLLFYKPPNSGVLIIIDNIIERIAIFHRESHCVVSFWSVNASSNANLVNFRAFSGYPIRLVRRIHCVSKIPQHQQLFHLSFLHFLLGYSSQLPQIMQQSGIEFFLTQKLSWNQVCSFFFSHKKIVHSLIIVDQ
jgi:hypothetical protein